MAEATTTTDHEQIRKWVEERDGHPARVRTSGDGGILRIEPSATQQMPTSYSARPPR